MFKLAKRTLGLVLAGSMVGLVGCVGFPGGVSTTTPALSSGSGAMSVGFAGAGYQVSSLDAAAAPASYTYQQVMFKPEAIEIHYAGPLTEAEAQQPAEEIEGEEVAQTQPEATVAATSDEATDSTQPSPDSWLKFPVPADFQPFDLVQLNGAVNSVTFGTSPLPVGKYDQIRFVARSADSQAKLTFAANDGTQDVTGTYFLPSGRLYLTQGFEVRKGYKTNLKFAFDVQKAVKQAGEKTLLQPTSVKVYADYEKIVEATPAPDASASTAQ